MIGTFYKAVFLALKSLMTLAVFGAVFAKPLFASENLVERPENELLILTLYVNEQLRDRSLLGYLPLGKDASQALLPIGALGRRLSYSIDVDTAGGIAQGWFVRENNVFQLDLGRQSVLVGGVETSYPDGVVEAHYEDIYIRADYLERWFGLEILTDTGQMRVDLKSEETLPFEEELARLERAEALSRSFNTAAPDYSNAKIIPYKGFSFPNVILQGATNVTRTPDDVLTFGGYSVQAAGDLLNFGTRFVASGTIDDDNTHSLQAVQLTFDRQDPGRNLLGPLKAGSYSFGDVDFPDVPLAVSGRRGRGFSVSSDSIISSSSVFTPEVTVIDGNGPIGWDAELYRNGFFVAFIEVGNDGRYVFDDVELIRGFNLFEIILYGPEGQKEVQSQRVVRGARMLRDGEASYDFAVGQPETDFIPLADDTGRDNAFGASGQFFYGLNPNLTLGASVFRGQDRSSVIDEQQTAGTVSAISSFLGFRTQLQLMQASAGRGAYDIEATTRFKGANLTVGHTAFDGFDNDDQRIKDRTSVSFNRNFNAFSASVQAEKVTFLENDDERIIDTTVSTNLLGFDLTNRLERVFADNSAQDRFDGELTAAVDLYDWRVRGNLDYDLSSDANQRLQGLQLSGLKRFGNDHSLRLNSDYRFDTNVTQADVRYTRQINDLSVDFNVAGDTENNYSAGVTLRTALQADDKGRYEFVNVRDGASGAVGLRAYVDENGNDVYDAGEALLKDVEFRSNRGLIDDLTGEDGVAFARGLQEGVTRFSIEEGSLPSIYLQPVTDYVDVIPRTGTTATVDLAFTQLGEIDGFIHTGEIAENSDPKGAPGLEVLLFDVVSEQEIESVNSEYDGYYVFSAIPLSTYRVEVVPAWGDGENLRTDAVVLDTKTPIKLDVNLTLPAMPGDDVAVEPLDIRAENGAVLNAVEAASGDTQPRQFVRSGIFVQMGALGSLGAADGEAARLRAAYASVLDDVVIREAVVKGRTYHRVLAPVETRKAGKALCKALKASGLQGCNVISM